MKFSVKNVIEDKKSGEYRLSHHLDLKTGIKVVKFWIRRINKLIFKNTDLIKIAVDAMGGDGSPKKLLRIVHNDKSNQENFFNIFVTKKLLRIILIRKLIKIFMKLLIRKML